ncbi:hypothetical protein LX32DRAFT_252966 [Colletotrichum zoysiae]|uniref:Uncharacterized protein n=1 Tax=Colletotrichum zoysiae TaxID=1216348 RepID=A0AAD9M9E6_9PEZI|nr:hypothetical protein LX32DRAFT_252966 [Colletotrichum zoysiae]
MHAVRVVNASRRCFGGESVGTYLRVFVLSIVCCGVAWRGVAWRGREQKSPLR